jgi:hypothetical protein
MFFMSNKWLCHLGFLLAFLLITPLLDAHGDDPDPLTVPHVWQRDKELDLRFNDGESDDGDYACAPCTAAAGIAWLGEKGYPSLLPKFSTKPAYSIARQLNLGMRFRHGGTGLKQFKDEIDSYVSKSGYRHEIAISSWNQASDYSVPPETSQTKELLKALATPRSVTWLELKILEGGNKHYALVVRVFKRDKEVYAVVKDPWEPDEDSVKELAIRDDKKGFAKLGENYLLISVVTLKMKTEPSK